MTTNSFSPARSRRTLRRLLSACQRDLAFYRYCNERVDDREISATLHDVVQVREHLATALSHSPGASSGDGIAQAERLGALRGWETAMRARLARDGDLAYVEEMERTESNLLEQVEDATLDPQLSTGMRITLERHLALVHSSHERAVATASRVRSRKQKQHGDGSRRHGRQKQHDPQHAGGASLTRAVSNFFLR